MDTATPTSTPAMPFADATPLGLIGLSIGCAALVPIAFGAIPSEPAKAVMMFKTASLLCLLFGAGCQFLAGVMGLANKNLLGGTLLTTFSFGWVFNWWALDSLAQGHVPDPSVGLAIDFTFIVIFVVLSYAFGFYSKLLFFFLLDIDALYLFRIVKHFIEPGAVNQTLGFGIGIATVVLAALALYIAFAMLVNPAAGRPVFPVAGPMFTPKKA